MVSSKLMICCCLARRGCSSDPHPVSARCHNSKYIHHFLPTLSLSWSQLMASLTIQSPPRKPRSYRLPRHLFIPHWTSLLLDVIDISQSPPCVLSYCCPRPGLCHCPIAGASSWPSRISSSSFTFQPLQSVLLKRRAATCPVKTCSTSFSFQDTFQIP